MTHTTTRTGRLLPILGAIWTIATAPAAVASNHSDAPLSKQDPLTNLTDVYAFVGTRYDNPSLKVLNVSMSFRPFLEPGDGANYDRFADDARYSLHITDPRDRRDEDPLRLRVLAGECRLQESEHDPVLRARHRSRRRSRPWATRARTSRRPSA